MLSEDDDILNGENSHIAPNWKEKYDKLVKAYQYVYPRYAESKQLLKEAVEFMNLVPNNMITIDGDIVDTDLDDPVHAETINHYELCSRIDKFLEER